VKELVCYMIVELSLFGEN